MSLPAAAAAPRVLFPSTVEGIVLVVAESARENGKAQRTVELYGKG